LYVELHGPPPPPRWVIVRRHIQAFPRTHFHPRAHSLLFCSDLLATALRSGPFTGDAKREAIRTFLSVAQGQNPGEASAYAERVELVSEWYGRGEDEPIGVEDLPDPAALADHN
jgi:hypothetical protein